MRNPARSRLRSLEDEPEGLGMLKIEGQGALSRKVEFGEVTGFRRGPLGNPV